jgi:hypothetical protein
MQYGHGHGHGQDLGIDYYWTGVFNEQLLSEGVAEELVEVGEN